MGCGLRRVIKTPSVFIVWLIPIIEGNTLEKVKDGLYLVLKAIVFEMIIGSQI